MKALIGFGRVVGQSTEAFSTETKLGDGWCVTTYEELVMWVLRQEILVRLVHKGVVVDELGNYHENLDELGSDSEGLTIARWTADALRVDEDSELAVEAWRLRYIEAMVVEGSLLVSAPGGMVMQPHRAGTDRGDKSEGIGQWRLAWTSCKSHEDSGMGEISMAGRGPVYSSVPLAGTVFG